MYENYNIEIHYMYSGCYSQSKLLSLLNKEQKLRGQELKRSLSLCCCVIFFDCETHYF